MHYVSTRGGGEPQTFSKILLEGLSADGGLYVPEEYPQVTPDELAKMRGMSYPELAFAVLSKYIDDIPPEELRKMISETYTKEVFGTDEIVPVREMEKGLFLLDLSEGPTLAFKDIALQLLGRLFEHALARSGEELNIFGATSGDTGSAA
ncbi:MAG: threonine synthase, partial [Patescibacteria group bacterium]|nr:threonine synthase [Patescibacteria group bacterium]